MLNKSVITLISVHSTVLITILLNKSYLHYTPMLLLTLIFHSFWFRTSNWFLPRARWERLCYLRARWISRWEFLNFLRLLCYSFPFSTRFSVSFLRWATVARVENNINFGNFHLPLPRSKCRLQLYGHYLTQGNPLKTRQVEMENILSSNLRLKVMREKSSFGIVSCNITLRVW